MTVVTRFAPSPTGELHLGSAYSAWTGWHRAREAGGRFLVRIEDIDIRRCKREFETAILDDLKWLGFDWDGEVRRQSDHFATYGKALDQLDARGLIYPCFCSRADDRARAGGLGQRATWARWSALSRHLPASVGAGAAGQDRRGPGALPAPRRRTRGEGSRARIISSTRRWAASRASRC